MKSTQALRTEIQALHRGLQTHYNQIETHKSGVNLVAALFSSTVRKQSLQTVGNARGKIEDILQKIQELQEQLFAASFLECFEDELSHLPDSLLLDPTTTQRIVAYDYAQYRSIKQKHSNRRLRKPVSHDN